MFIRSKSGSFQNARFGVSAVLRTRSPRKNIRIFTINPSIYRPLNLPEGVRRSCYISPSAVTGSYVVRVRRFNDNCEMYNTAVYAFHEKILQPFSEDSVVSVIRVFSVHRESRWRTRDGN